MAEITRKVAQSSDDCNRRLHTDLFGLTELYNRAGYYSSSSYQYGCGLRFQNIAIPNGATIISATIKFKCRLSCSGTVCRTRLSGEDVDDAPTFANDKDAFDARWANRTTVKVDWDNIPAWVVDNFYDSPDIKSVIQEIVDREGWESGNDIVIFWEDFEDRSDHNNNARRGAYSYDGDPDNPPELTIDYGPPVAKGRSFGYIIG
jgi:type IV pilus assembly protein PilY1